MKMNSRGGPAADDRVLQRYLLGSLPADETDRLDELSIADDAVAARLQAVEQDLVDAYVNGELSGDDLSRFRERYLSSPSSLAKVGFARALSTYRPKRPEAARGVMATWATPRRWAFAAAAAVLLAAAGYFALDNLRLRREATTARAAVEQDQDLRRQLDQQRSAAAQAAGELARTRQALARTQERAAAGQPVGRTGIFTFMLLPPTRGAADVPAVAIPQGTGDVVVRLELEVDDFPKYRGVLEDPATGKDLWHSGDLESSALGRNTSVSVLIPSRLLKPHTYVLELTGVAASGAAEMVGSYSFRVR